MAQRKIKNEFLNLQKLSFSELASQFVKLFASRLDAVVLLKRLPGSEPHEASRRRRHFAVERLSPQGKSLVDSLLRKNQPYQQITKALREKTGEKLATSSLQRYYTNLAARSANRKKETEIYG